MQSPDSHIQITNKNLAAVILGYLAGTACPRDDTLPLAWEHSADPTMLLRSNFTFERL